MGSKKLRKLISKWVKNEKATTAIEFSLLAIPYVFLTIGIIELSIMYAAASLVEGATGSAARLIRTGQIQQGTGDPLDTFQAALCDYASVLVNCNDMTVEVITLGSFADAPNFPPAFDDDGNLVSSGFAAGGSSDKILIRVFYRYSMMTPFVGTLLAGADNTRYFISTIVLQTEPYEFAGGS